MPLVRVAVRVGRAGGNIVPEKLVFVVGILCGKGKNMQSLPRFELSDNDDECAFFI